MKPASDMRSGMCIRLDGDLFRVMEAEYHAGGGKMHGSVHAKLRNVATGGLTERRFRQDERFEEVELERESMDFLYEEADGCVFMHPETYEQVTLPKESLGAYLPYVQPNQSLQVEFLDGAPVEVKYPASVELVVDTTPDPIHSDDSNVFKVAILKNGMEVQVPQFVKSGDTIRIEVETGKYLERVL
ncbi:MAG: elongation factor P [Acidobacteria bacterium]|nr:MAG: elongation factor P [Acidobacteriota bacterium]